MNSFHLLAPEFLPPVSYFLPFLKSRTILIADHLQYTKRTNLTRSGSLKNGLKLNIPVKSTGLKKAIFEKEIAYIENWDRKHLTSLYHLYHTLPYFEDYYYNLEDIYKDHPTHLNSFLFDQIDFFIGCLKIKCDLRLTSNEGFKDTLEENLIRFAEKYSQVMFLYNIQDVKAGYINPDKLHDANIETQPLAAFDDSSLKHINILEFLFKNGPEAAFQIRATDTVNKLR